MTISNELKECYLHFNVYDISDKIKKLSEKERYILAISSVDNHDEDNVICLHNFNTLKIEINDVLNYLDDNVENNIIKELKVELGSTIDISEIDLPKVLTKGEIREIKLDNIL